MNRTKTLQLMMFVAALITSAGCGDEAPQSACEASCQRADSCPNLSAESDCVSACESLVEEAQKLGGTCPGAIDEVIACHTGLSCAELTNRVVGGFYNDECVAVEQAALRCEPGEAIVPSQSPDELPVDELTLACEATCSSIDSCPTTRAESNCVQICVSGYSDADNGTAACRSAIIDTLNCQAAMTCGEIDRRVRRLRMDDSCRSADEQAGAICFG